MSKEKFKVIKGGGTKAPMPQYKFIKGFVTNTRLMGVIGMKLYWETEEKYEYVQFFHLDFEEYGIDGFESLTKAREDEIELVTNKMMGGLGGSFMSINKEEAICLINESNKININTNQELPGFVEEYLFLVDSKPSLTKDEETNLWYKICEPIDNPVQVTNYFLMRSVGLDKEGQSFLSINETIDYTPTEKPCTLIKNVVETSHENDGKSSYNVESVIDLDRGYQLIISEIDVVNTDEGPKIASAEVKSKMKISTIEAAFQLKKPEYILIYSIEEDFVEFIEVFDIEKPEAMQNIHKAGFLYTEFKPTNDHVKDNIYYLNGDINAVYYITTGNQLAVSTFEEKNLKKIKKYFKSEIYEGLLELESEFKVDSPMIYEYVQSGYDDFYEFINDESE